MRVHGCADGVPGGCFMGCGKGVVVTWGGGLGCCLFVVGFVRHRGGGACENGVGGEDYGFLGRNAYEGF